MTPIFFDFPQPTILGSRLKQKLQAQAAEFLIKPFPDGETYLRILSNVKGKNIVIHATLFQPNDWILNLIFLADGLRAQGAKSIGLVAPYLSYMRQDKIFHPGEVLTSKTFSSLLSHYFDYMITVDPHLHRYHSLDEIYTIPTTVVQAAPLLSQWIQDHVSDPFLIGPDQESAQWVEEIAGVYPYVILEKVRHSGTHVEITWPETLNFQEKTIVLVDDIISSGETMIQVLRKVKKNAPICLALHPLFAGKAYQKLRAEGARQIVTCNSIPHPSNQIDLTPLLIPPLKKYLS